MNMKQIVLLLCLVLIFSCKNQDKNQNNSSVQKTVNAQDTLQKSETVDVKKSLASAPRFGVKEADEFVQNAKKVFTEMKKAEEAQDMDKLMKLTAESNALNLQLENALLKLEPSQQTKLQEWYSTAASAIEE